MRHYLLLFLLTLTLTILHAQDPAPARKALTTWQGNYHGTMTISSLRQPPSPVAVTLELHPLPNDTTGWVYRLTFDSEQYGKTVKDYRLYAKSPADTVNYLLDERNGITMPQTLLNDCLYGMYNVMGTTYVSTLRRLPDGELLWDLFGAKQEVESTSRIPAGNGKEEEDIVVEAFRPNFQQTVFLRRKRSAE